MGTTTGRLDKTGRCLSQLADDVTIENVIRYANEHLMFTCMFRGASVFYDFPMLDEKTANKVAAILNDHVGQTLTSIAFVEISEGEA